MLEYSIKLNFHPFVLGTLQRRTREPSPSLSSSSLQSLLQKSLALLDCPNMWFHNEFNSLQTCFLKGFFGEIEWKFNRWRSFNAEVECSLNVIKIISYDQSRSSFIEFRTFHWNFIFEWLGCNLSWCISIFSSCCIYKCCIQFDTIVLCHMSMWQDRYQALPEVRLVNESLKDWFWNIWKKKFNSI